MKAFKCLAAVMLLVAVSACSTLGLTTPQSPSQELAYAYGVVSGLETSTAQALQAGTISAATAQKILSYADDATDALSAAQTLIVNGGSTATVTSDLSTAESLISQMQALLPATAAK